MRVVAEILWCLLVLAILVAFTGVAARGGEVCLSKAEARKLWPKQHLYWYSADHCWSNRRGGPPRGIKVEPIPTRTKKPAPDLGRVYRAEEYNPIDQALDRPLYFDAGAILHPPNPLDAE